MLNNDGNIPHQVTGGIIKTNVNSIIVQMKEIGDMGRTLYRRPD
jgi:hypothetical protein